MKEFKYCTEYCGSRKVFDEMKNHDFVLQNFIKFEHIKQDYDSGEFGWIKISFNTTEMLLIFFKQIVQEEVKEIFINEIIKI